MSTTGADKPTIPADAPAPGANAYAHSYYRTHYLEAWQTQIDALETALRDAERNRTLLAETADAAIHVEAETSITIEGRNEAEWKAKLTLTLHENAHYRALLADQRKAEELIRDADARAAVARNRIALYRAIVEGWPK